MANSNEDGEDGGISGEYSRPDAAAALEIYKSEIAPKLAHMSTIKGDLSDPYKRIKDDCNFPRKVLDFAMQLDDMEDAKRDHWLLAMSLVFNELGLFVPRDLVTMAKGEDGGNIIPFAERQSSDLATLGDDDDFEAGEDEIAAQESRPSTVAAKARSDSAKEAKTSGTGAAARAAMNQSAKAKAAAAEGATVN